MSHVRPSDELRSGCWVLFDPNLRELARTTSVAALDGGVRRWPYSFGRSPAGSPRQSALGSRYTSIAATPRDVLDEPRLDRT